MRQNFREGYEGKSCDIILKRGARVGRTLLTAAPATAWSGGHMQRHVGLAYLRGSDRTESTKSSKRNTSDHTNVLTLSQHLAPQVFYNNN